MFTVNHTRFAIIWIVLCVFARLIPHPPNVTPLTNLCLFAGSQLSRLMSLLITFAALITSDLLLAYYQGYPAFGSWTLFSYSGFGMIVFLGRKLVGKSWPQLILFVLCSSLGFWLWTNLGVWLLGHLYPLTLEGLIICYTAALPFLRNAMLGDLSWALIIFGTFEFMRRTISTKISTHHNR